MKENKRYLLIFSRLGKDETTREIKESIISFTGRFGYEKANLKIIEAKEKEEKTQMIIAINIGELDNVRAALCLSKKQLIVKKISGTLKKLR